jgi:tetratricopeptide (TPR) repeat protein
MDQFNFEDLFEIIIPVLLQLRNDYYVKGGRAYDAYFKDKTDSKDWDIVGTKECFDFLILNLKQFSKKWKLNLHYDPTVFPNGDSGYQVGFKEVWYEKNDPYFLDFSISSNIEFIILNNIQYMLFMDFSADLLKLASIRQEKFSELRRSISEEGNIPKSIEEFNKKYGVDFGLENSFEQYKYKTVSLMKQVVHQIKNSELKSFQEKIIERFQNNVSNFKQAEDFFKNLYSKDFEDDDQYFELESFYEDILDIYSAHRYFQNNISEFNLAENKFHKTIKRRDNLLNISWKNLSTEYKRLLLLNCTRDEVVKIFGQPGRSCLAYFDCKELKLVKETTGCK